MCCRGNSWRMTCYIYLIWLRATLKASGSPAQPINSTSARVCVCVCVCVSIQYLRGRNGVTVREEDCLCEALLIILKVSKEKTDSKEHYERLTLLCWTSLLSLLTCNNLSSVFAYSFPKTWSRFERHKDGAQASPTCKHQVSQHIL